MFSSKTTSNIFVCTINCVRSVTFNCLLIQLSYDKLNANTDISVKDVVQSILKLETVFKLTRHQDSVISPLEKN